MGLQPGQLYNAEDGRKALRDVFALGLFDNVQIFPRPNQKDESKVHSPYMNIIVQPFDWVTPAILLCWADPFSCGAMPLLRNGVHKNAMTRRDQACDERVYVQVDVDIMVKERPMKSADIEAEWQIAPGPNGRAAVASIVPGGTLTFEHRNIARKGRQVRPAMAPLSPLSPGLALPCCEGKSAACEVWGCGPSSCCVRAHSVLHGTGACHHSRLLCLLHSGVSFALAGQGFTASLGHASGSYP